jgi:acyl homoserine lactone synthase
MPAALARPNPIILQLPARPAAAVLAEEPGFSLEHLEHPGQLEQAYRLRHRLFAETLRWVPEHPSGLEIDEYDAFTEMIGILDPGGRLLGQVRMHEATVPFMIEHEFAQVLGGGAMPLKGRDTAEITRFGLHPDARALTVEAAGGRYDLFTLLLKGIYRWSLAHGVRTVLAVVDHRVFRLLHLRGFPFEALAEPKVMPDGVVALAIRLEWDRFLEVNRTRRPGLVAWFDQGAPAGLRKAAAGPASAPWPRPGCDSRHPASGRCSSCGS